jgi:hypothetical protein
VITSRSTDLPDVDDIITVNTLSPPDAEKFLRDRVRAANPAAADEDLTEVLKRLDGMPLALEHEVAAREPSWSCGRLAQLG